MSLSYALALFFQLAVTSPAAAPAKTEVVWMGHAAWLVKTPGGAQLAIDPWFDNPKAPKDVPVPADLDAILISHGHFDHTGDAAELAGKSGAVVVGSYELVGLLGLPEGKAFGANAGGTVKIKDATIHLVEAVHSSGFGKPGQTPQYGGAPVGFVIEIQHGPTLYHAGDTDAFSSMALIGERYHPSVAMLPIGGHFTMDPAGAALAAKLLKVQTILPMHYGTFPLLKGTPAELRAAVGNRIKVLEPKPGEKTQL